jgi:hypothetical protein
VAKGKEQVKKRRRERNYFITVKTWPKRPLSPQIVSIFRELNAGHDQSDG